MPGIFRHSPFPTQPDPSAATLAPPAPQFLPWTPDQQLDWWAAFRPPLLPGPPPDSAVAAFIGPPKNVVPTPIPSGFVCGTPLVTEGWPYKPWDQDPALQVWSGYKRPTDPLQVYSTVSTGTVIIPVPIPSGFVCGAPYIAGGPVRITVPAIPSGFVCGPPKVVGGANPQVSLYIGGVLFPILVEGASDPIPGAGAATKPQFSSQTIGRWTFQCDVFSLNNVFVPIVGQTVQLFDFGNRAFMGCINDVVSELLTGSDGQVIHHITCVDKSGILDHRVINAVYLSGSDVVAAVRDIILNWCGQEGITLNTLPLTLTALDADEQFYFVSAASALDKLATDTACVWWVDQQGDLHFVPIVSLPPCPYTVDSTTAGVWRALSVRTTLLDYRNKEYVISNLQTLPAASSGAASLAVTETYTLPQPRAVGAGYGIGIVVTNLNIGSVVSLTVNGVPQPVYPQDPFHNFYETWNYLPQYPYLYTPNFNNDFPSLPAPGPTSPNANPGDVVVITYVPIAPAGSPTGVTQTAGIASAAALTAPNGTCGSGIYEVVDQVKNVNLLSDLNAIAASILARSGGVPKYCQFETDLPGAQVGQQITINVPELGATYADSFMITSIQATDAGGNLGHGSAFKSVIVAQTGQDLGNQIKWFERLVARTENALPVLQYEICTFVLAPGSSIAAGVNLTNPYPVRRSGRLVDVVISPATPPVGQSLVVDIQDNNASIFGGVKPSLPPSVPANGSITYANLFKQGAASFVFSGDILSISASYAVTGASTAQAGAVTVVLRWAI